MATFNTNDPDAAAFAALVEPWLRARPHLRDFSQLHFALDGLEYLLHTDRSGVAPSQPKSTAHVKCSMHDCDVTSATPDACLLNFAPVGDAPLWFCRAHHPRLDGLLAPGWTPSYEHRAHVVAATTAAWNKLDATERPLLNRNIVTVAAGSSGLEENP